jgi:hypothetical protein
VRLLYDVPPGLNSGFRLKAGMTRSQPRAAVLHAEKSFAGRGDFLGEGV